MNGQQGQGFGGRPSSQYGQTQVQVQGASVLPEALSGIPEEQRVCKHVNLT